VSPPHHDPGDWPDVLHETSLAVMRRLEVPELLETIVTSAARLAGTLHGYAYLLTEAGDEIEVRAGTGLFLSWIGYRMRPGQGVAGRVLQTGRPLMIEDYETWEGRSPTFPLGLIRAVTGVPLTSGDRVVGVIGLAHLQDGLGFSQEDLAILIRFAELASVALDNARLYAVAERELRERQRTEEQLRQAESKYRTLVEQIPAVLYIDLPDEADTTLYVSPQIETMLGLSPKAYIDDPGLWRSHVHPEDRERAVSEYRRGLERGVPFHSEYRMVRPDGEVVWVRDQMLVLPDQTGRPELVQGIMFDITQRKLAEEQVAFLAYHDRLTGLPNRPMFEESLELALARARRHGAAVAVMSMDLDNFKLVNDGLGRAAGDELLREVASRLRAQARETDIVARPGGDEFLVLLADLEQPAHPETEEAPAAVAEAVAERIQADLARPFVLAGTEAYVSASIGISLFPQHAEDPESMLGHAESAMSRSRQSGPGGHAMFAQPAADSVRRLSFVTRLRKAVEEQQWVLHYQPIVDLADGRTIGVEALIRWVDPGGGLTLPGDFIPVAEELGLIAPIGDWVFEELCRQFSAWRDQGITLDVSFNLSPLQLWQPRLVDKLASELQSAGVPSQSVVAELTESAAMTDPERTGRTLQDLSELGLRLAIDDFGTGYSSLSRLNQLPVDILKIDRPFVRGLPDDRQSASAVTAVIQLAESLGMQSLAEGIETEDQWRFLKDHGCLLGQGFHFGAPMAAEALTARLLTPGHAASM
jgi:diguanylate cyclase (GGDEF)-like protein/PAS domain S-box-containing protein